jgi:hypothetical protein
VDTTVPDFTEAECDLVAELLLQRHRRHFFYADADQYGTGHESYTDLRRCVLTVLRVQADHESQSAGISSGATAADLEQMFGFAPGTSFAAASH